MFANLLIANVGIPRNSQLVDILAIKTRPTVIAPTHLQCIYTIRDNVRCIEKEQGSWPGRTRLDGITLLQSGVPYKH